MTLGAANHHALRSVGFIPLGPASGSSVFTNSAPAPWCGSDEGEFEVVHDQAAVWLQYQGWTTALARLREHCARMGGDGVIGVRLSQQRLGRRVEFTASGTAVCADGWEYLTPPFTAHLGDGEFAGLLSAGWVPVNVAVGVAVVRGHHVPAMSLTTGEHPGNTKVLGDAMAAARRALHDDALRHGPDGVVVHEVTTDVGKDECSQFEGGTDVEASVVIVGTAIAQFRRTHRPPLTVMPLHRGGTR